MKTKIAVISHHRSGTHFLMRSIALNSPYTDKPPWVLDYPLGVDIWATPALNKYLKRHAGESVREIMKCHFSVEFFDGILANFTKEFHVFYIVRNPEDTMASYHKFSNGLKWLEAPKVETVSEFIRSEPEGSCLRWQRRQYPNMIARWSCHVAGWMDAASRHAIHVVRYEDLYYEYNETMKQICSIIGVEVGQLKKPEMTGIRPWKGGDHGNLYSNPDREFIQASIDPCISGLWQRRQ